MRRVIERHGGTVEKFIGDAVMAVFGIPTLHEDDALRAVRAAHEMQSAVELLNEELASASWNPIALRIGVNTGEVVAGEATAGHTLVTGDAVNVAARLEQAADPGQVLLGGTTHRLVRSLVETEPMPPLELKGKADPVEAHRLISVGDRAPIRRHDTPLVGRARELHVLEEAFDRANEEQACYLFTLLGHGRCRQVATGARVPWPNARPRAGPARPMSAVWRGHHLLAGDRARAGGSGHRAE